MDVEKHRLFLLITGNLLVSFFPSNEYCTLLKLQIHILLPIAIRLFKFKRIFFQDFFSVNITTQLIERQMRDKFLSHHILLTFQYFFSIFSFDLYIESMLSIQSHNVKLNRKHPKQLAIAFLILKNI